eukprot:1480340-Pleurochrysis_carterae.AAC.2
MSLGASWCARLQQRYQVAVSVDPAPVARAKPAVRREGARVGIVARVQAHLVPFEDARAAHDHLALLTKRK